MTFIAYSLISSLILNQIFLFWTHLNRKIQIFFCCKRQTSITLIDPANLLLT